MSLLNDIHELVKSNVITPETAGRIRDYYRHKESKSGNRLVTVFGMLGATLVGLGIILIIAHNWDELSRPVKTGLSFLPLILGQIFCGFTLLKKADRQEWREGATAFLFCAVGASISLVAQVYNIHGDLASFVLTWMLLCLPLVYVMRSSVASLFYLVGITFYACETNYFGSGDMTSYLYWALFLLVLPHYYDLYKNKPESNFMMFHNWLVPLSLVVTLGTVTHRFEELMFVAYISLFGLFYLIGSLDFFKENERRNNDYLILGSLGTVTLLLFLTFDSFWVLLSHQKFPVPELVASPEFFAGLIITLLAGVLFYKLWQGKSLSEIKPVQPAFIIFLLIFLIGTSFPLTAVVLINILVLAIGILTIRDGSRRDHLGILNYGLFIIMILVICRFFDTDLSFVLRGLMFVSVGFGFFIANYRMIKKRKAND